MCFGLFRPFVKLTAKARIPNTGSLADFLSSQAVNYALNDQGNRPVALPSGSLPCQQARKGARQSLNLPTLVLPL